MAAGKYGPGLARATTYPQPSSLRWRGTSKISNAHAARWPGPSTRSLCTGRNSLAGPPVKNRRVSQQPKHEGSTEHRPDLLRYSRGVHLVFREQLIGGAAFSEYVLHPDPQQPATHASFGDRLRNRRPQSARDLMVLRGDHQIGPARRIDHGRAVQRLDGVNVDHADAQTLLLEQVGRLNGQVDFSAGCEDHGVLADRPQLYRLTEAKLVSIAVDALELLPRGSQVRRSAVTAEIFHRALGLEVIRRLDDRHPRQAPQQGQILQPLLRVAILSNRDPGVASHQSDVRLRVRDGNSNLVETAADEARE